MSEWDGLPENPERDGWHWLKSTTHIGKAFPGWWNTRRQCWRGHIRDGEPGTVAKIYEYAGAMTPGQATPDRYAEGYATGIEAAADWHASVAANIERVLTSGESNESAREDAMHRHKAYAATIRALPTPTPTPPKNDQQRTACEAMRNLIRRVPDTTTREALMAALEKVQQGT